MTTLHVRLGRSLLIPALTFISVLAMSLVLSAAWAREPAAAGGGPDLVVRDLNPASWAPPGGTLAVTDVIRNIGGGRADASVVRYYLSLDARRGSGDLRLEDRR